MTEPQASAPAKAVAPAATTADELLRASARQDPHAPALWRDGEATCYATLDARVDDVAAGLRALLPIRGARVAVWLDKRIDTVVALFAAMRAGHVALPVNPALRGPQVLACLGDARAGLLLTDAARLTALEVAGARRGDPSAGPMPWLSWADGSTMTLDVDTAVWRTLGAQPALAADPSADSARTRRPVLRRDAEELAILFYTSGSTGAPKGVMATHANLVAGATAVNQCLGHTSSDRLLAALPLSFDAGFAQLTTAFAAGASVVLLDHLFPADVLAALATHRITGLTAVPPLYLQLLAALQRTDATRPDERPGRTLRYFGNTGGHLPRAAWDALRGHWPQAQPVAMYGLTEAFRASWLPPADFERKPDSVGIALPGGTRLRVVRADGTPCAAGEPGELVQDGPLVTRGYWNDPARSAQRFRPGADGAPTVWSGDTVVRDADGYLRFVGRDDEQIKTSGYRVSPTEVESAAAAAGWPECIALGVPDALLGQAIRLVVADPGGGAVDAAADDAALTALKSSLRARLPAWMLPRDIVRWAGPLPRSANGKFDRVQVRDRLAAPATPARTDAADAADATASGHVGSLLPVDPRGGLLLGGTLATHLVEQLATPLYVLDSAQVRRRVAEVRALLPADVRLHYAIKANPLPALLQVLAPLVDGYDIASAGELQRALETGCCGHQLGFAGPGKRDAELQAAIDASAVVSIESAGELARLAALAADSGKAAQAAVRVNPDFELRQSGMRMGGGAQVFGVDAEDVPELLAGWPDGVDFAGFHIYAGSQNLNGAQVADALRRSHALCSDLARHAPATPRLFNLGGGLGIPYFAGERRIDTAPVAAALADLAAVHRSAFPHTALVLELGRYLVGEAGVFLTRVLDRKRSRGREFLVCDGGMHQHLAASGNFGQVIRRDYPVWLARSMMPRPPARGAMPTDPPHLPFTVCGPLCTPLDVLAREAVLPADVQAGDLLVVGQSGAYGATASPSGFLSHPPAREIVV